MHIACTHGAHEHCTHCLCTMCTAQMCTMYITHSRCQMGVPQNPLGNNQKHTKHNQQWSQVVRQICSAVLCNRHLLVSLHVRNQTKTTDTENSPLANYSFARIFLSKKLSLKHIPDQCGYMRTWFNCPVHHRTSIILISGISYFTNKGKGTVEQKSNVLSIVV